MGKMPMPLWGVHFFGIGVKVFVVGCLTAVVCGCVHKKRLLTPLFWVVLVLDYCFVF